MIYPERSEIQTVKHTKQTTWLDIIKMTAYRAETAMANSLRENPISS